MPIRSQSLALLVFIDTMAPNGHLIAPVRIAFSMVNFHRRGMTGNNGWPGQSLMDMQAGKQQNY
jgi:hypothetical protein